MGYAPQMFTSNKKDWTTPAYVLDRVRKVFAIGLDPCDNAQSLTKPRISVRVPEKGKRETDGIWYRDGLALEGWGDFIHKGEGVFVNWPYGTAENRLWAKKVQREVENNLHLDVILLVAVRTSETWFQDHVLAAKPACIGYFHKRLRFSNAKHVATFSSQVIYFGKNVDKFKVAFSDVCAFWDKPRRGNYSFGRQKSEVAPEVVAKREAKLALKAERVAAREAKKKPGKKKWLFKQEKPKTLVAKKVVRTSADKRREMQQAAFDKAATVAKQRVMSVTVRPNPFARAFKKGVPSVSSGPPITRNVPPPRPKFGVKRSVLVN